MRPKKQAAIAKDEDFEKEGVPKIWIPALRQLGIQTLENLKTASDTKLFNDLNGLRKKLKLETPPLQLAEVQGWIKNK
jgi:lysyl-tRNA synthetase class 2